MCMTLGGRVAESLIFNRVTTGAQNDLEKVTKMAYAQIKEYGMNSHVGLVCFPEQEEKQLGRRPYSKQFASIIDVEARQLIGQAYRATEELLQKHKTQLELVSDNKSEFYIVINNVFDFSWRKLC